MKKWILLFLAPVLFHINVLSAEQLATTLRGKIVTSNPTGMQVLITESDGSILDMSDISAKGIYHLDLTVMDEPSQAEVKKLIVEVKDKSGKKRKFLVNRYLSSFDDTVLLKPIPLN